MLIRAYFYHLFCHRFAKIWDSHVKPNILDWWSAAKRAVRWQDYEVAVQITAVAAPVTMSGSTCGTH